MRTYFVKVGFYVFTQPYAYQTIIKCLPEDVIDVAKAAVVNKYRNCNILIFSDDIDWCRDNFSCYRNVYFPHGKAYEDMILMSLCDNVIVNEKHLKI